MPTTFQDDPNEETRGLFPNFDNRCAIRPNHERPENPQPILFDRPIPLISCSPESRSAILHLVIQAVLDCSNYNLNSLRSHEVEALIRTTNVVAIDLAVSAAVVHREDVMLLLRYVEM
jgi:hypothetical protein